MMDGYGFAQKRPVSSKKNESFGESGIQQPKSIRREQKIIKKHFQKPEK